MSLYDPSPEPFVNSTFRVLHTSFFEFATSSPGTFASFEALIFGGIGLGLPVLCPEVSPPSLEIIVVFLSWDIILVESGWPKSGFIVSVGWTIDVSEFSAATVNDHTSLLHNSTLSPFICCANAVTCQLYETPGCKF